MSGGVTAPISAAATVTRDSIGVPHIEAGTIEDALFLQGYVHAQDRLWQMDSLRRLVAGELAEIAGPRALPLDEEARRLRLRRIAEQEYSRLSAADRLVLTSYARGVNFFLETHQNALPIEFTLGGYQPRPWSGVDSLLAGIQIWRDLTSSGKDDIAKGTLRGVGNRSKVDYLFPLRTGSEFSPGSNAWAISGRLTASGKPLLANDPHLPWGLPSAWYLNHLRAPGLNVTGASLVGLPCVIIGHNDRLAWGVTNLHYDVQDLYVERINMQNGQYLFRGQVEQAHAEREVIRVKDGKPIDFANWVTRHGPIWSSTPNGALAVRWMAAEPGVISFPFLDLNRARNWTEFLGGLRRFGGPGQNFVYADVDGNIGYHAAGRLPIRQAFQGDVPVDGASGNFEWEQFIPFDELPSAFNPASGMVITANQNPFPADYRYPVSGSFAPHYRSQQIRDRLRSRQGWKAQELLAIQKDVYSPFAHNLARRLVIALERRGVNRPELQGVTHMLRSWNGQMDKDLAAPFIVTLVFQNFRRMVAENAAGSTGAQAYASVMSPAVLENLLRDKPKGWFADYDATLVHALTDAMEEGRRLQGRAPDRWRYGGYLQLEVSHPVLRQIPYLGSYFTIGPVPMSGASTTVKQTVNRLGPSMRMVADTGDWDRSLQNLPFGQSGQPLSSHFKDQWDEYYVGNSLPMKFWKIEGDVLRFSPAR